MSIALHDPRVRYAASQQRVSRVKERVGGREGLQLTAEVDEAQQHAPTAHAVYAHGFEQLFTWLSRSQPFLELVFVLSDYGVAGVASNGKHGLRFFFFLKGRRMPFKFNISDHHTIVSATPALISLGPKLRLLT